MDETQRRYRSILIFGEPGSGKGTQGKVLGTVPGFFHLACGDVFRTLDPISDLGKTFLEHSSKGKLVPDNFTVQLWRERILRLVQTGEFRPDQEILVLDGIPRNRHQAEMMEHYIQVILLIYLEARDQETLIQRIRRRALRENRLDDADEKVIRTRFREYMAETEPVLAYYPAEIIRKVEAGAAPIDVLLEVVEAVRDVAARA